LLKAGYDREAAQSFGTRFGNQIAVAVTVTCWTCLSAGIMFYVADKTVGIRTEDGGEDGGLDLVDFGGEAYEAEGIAGMQSQLALIGASEPVSEGGEKLTHDL